MKLLEVYAKLKDLKIPVITTKELAVLLDIKNATASKILARLAVFNPLSIPLIYSFKF